MNFSEFMNAWPRAKAKIWVYSVSLFTKRYASLLFHRYHRRHHHHHIPSNYLDGWTTNFWNFITITHTDTQFSTGFGLWKLQMPYRKYTKITMSKNEIKQQQQQWNAHISKIEHRIYFKADSNIPSEMGLYTQYRYTDYHFIFPYLWNWIYGDCKLYVLRRNNNHNAYSNNDEHIIYLQNNWFFKGILRAYKSPLYEMQWIFSGFRCPRLRRDFVWFVLFFVYPHKYLVKNLFNIYKLSELSGNQEKIVNCTKRRRRHV